MIDILLQIKGAIDDLQGALQTLNGFTQSISIDMNLYQSLLSRLSAALGAPSRRPTPRARRRPQYATDSTRPTEPLQQRQGPRSQWDHRSQWLRPERVAA